MDNGDIDYSVNLATKDSTFKVYTDSLTISVVGTKFNIKVNPDRKFEITVSEGTVQICDLIKLNQPIAGLKEKYGDIYLILKNIIDKKIPVSNETRKINYKNVLKINNKINKIIDKLNNKTINENELNNFTDKLRKIDIEINNIFENNLKEKQIDQINLNKKNREIIKKTSLKGKKVKIVTIEGSTFIGILLTNDDAEEIILKTSFNDLSILKENVVSIKPVNE
jgi:hypothetical protein